MKWMKRIAYVLCLVAFLGAMTGCSEDGPAEKAGRQIDEAMDAAKDKMNEMGDQAKDAYEDMKDQAKEAMEK